MKVKIEVGNKYNLTDGNGGIVEGKVIDVTKKPARILYVVRKTPNVGRFTLRPYAVTVPAFKKLLVSQDA